MNPERREKTKLVGFGTRVVWTCTTAKWKTNVEGTLTSNSKEITNFFLILSFVECSHIEKKRKFVV